MSQEGICGSSKAEMDDLYSILGASPSSSEAELKRCYHKLIREHHPDKNGNQNDSSFICLHEAWKVLSDEQSRKIYDANLKANESKYSCPIHEEISLKELTWDSELKHYKNDCRCGGKYVLCQEDTIHGLIAIDCDNCSLSILVDCDTYENKDVDS